MGLGEGLTQAQGVAMASLTRDGYEGWRVEKHMMNAVTPAGTPYHLGLKIDQRITRGGRAGENFFSDADVRRRRSLNIEMDMVGLTDVEYRTVGNSADKLEALLIQKKTKKFMHNIPNDLKRKLLEESIQLLRR